MDRRISTFELVTVSAETYAKMWLKGKLVYHTQQIAKQKMEMALAEIDKNIVIMDVSQLLFIDSTGLALLIHFLKKAVCQDKQVALVVSTNKTLEKILAIAKFDKLFPIVKREEDLARLLASRTKEIASQKMLLEMWRNHCIQN
ncbi:STAS domain-containing protein [Saccharococcus thermophilus]|uniref:Anti-anti-sigma factor n=1 Tax=Saccharococcus thermophilus TaxID=29396 RepID=A0A846MFS8_9BACL|nr:STAS domain-containing protein [Saccharococcus thermophilus]NIK14749.1 anti-anti-sigma factor [Saccharococcus thermophilus]